MRDVSNIVELLREEENSGKLISLIDITKQKKAEQTIKHSLEFEKTISVISSRFIGSYDNDDAVNMSLSEIGNFTGASRVYLFLLRNNGTIMNNTHEWCNKGVIPQKDILQNIPTEASPWWIGKLRKGEIIHIDDVSKMPEEASFEKNMLEKREIKSLLVFPLKIGEKLNGFIGLDNILDTGKWSYEDFVVLRVCSEIIGSALQRRQIEEGVQKSNKLMNNILESISDGFFALDDNLVVTYFNKAAEKLLNRKREDVIGYNLFEAFPEGKGSIFEDKYTQGVKEKKFIEFETFFNVGPYKNWYDVRVYPQKNGISVYFQIITDRKQAEEKIKNILESSPDAITVTDLQGNITECNEATLRLYGFSTKDEVIGKNAFMFFPKREQKRAMENLKNTLNEGSVKNVEYISLTKDGKEFSVELSASVINDASGNPVSFVAITKDITERKKAEEKIKQQNIKLRKLDQLKSDFLNVASHELRTPLSSIKGYVQMLLIGSLGEITNEQKNSLEIVLRNTNRLDRLIQDILDLSQLESGTMDFVPEEANVQKMIDEVTESMQSSADLKDIKIDREVEEKLPNLNIDSERIKQVIINLVNNAIKFSPDGSIINIRAKKNVDDILFEVQDFGRGIPKDKQDKIFEAFYQVDSGMKRSFGGAGLGLSLAKNIILAHEGKIWVESSLNEGSTFRFTLPIKSDKDIESRFKEVGVSSLEKEVWKIRKNWNPEY